MRGSWLALSLLAWSASVGAAPLTSRDIAILRGMSDHFVQGWLRNDSRAVMSVLSRDAVFIPHDGVKPHIGYAKIEDFWFPKGKARGVVSAFTHAITDVSGAENHATIYGRSDLTWHNDTQRYHWIGNFLFVARKKNGRWLFTHLMSSDEPPKIEPLGAN